MKTLSSERILVIRSCICLLQDQTFKQQHFELIDECGQVNTISEHVAMMIPFYYIPLLLLLIVLVVKLSMKIRAIYKDRYAYYLSHLECR